ncbi:MAG: type II toxin-antitoxin system Phd/YefM family antitoxin [Planctomycetes bacterium]|nr:type II toxin-antitoxin system Phd/YefM family antitoxin [Planctomycetota bacterium]
MSLSIEPISHLKKHSADVVNKAKETQQPVMITQNGKAVAMVVDVESWQKQEDSLNMLKLVLQGERDIQKGLLRSHEEVRERMQKRLKRLRSDS